MTQLLYINGLDAYATWGVFLAEDKPSERRNYAQLLTPPPTKARQAVSFAEEDGERLPRDLAPAHDARDLTLTFALTAPSKSAFLTRYSAFLQALKTGQKGWLELRLTELAKTYTLYYLSASSYRQLTPLEGGAVAALIDIKFREPKPTI